MPVRALIVGDSGTGKTAAILGLLKAGIPVIHADFDQGSDYIRARLDDATRKLYHPKLFIDIIRPVGQSQTIQNPNAWMQFVTALSKWEPFGGLDKFPKDAVFIIDTLTYAARCVMRHQQLAAGNWGKPLTARDYGPIQQTILSMFDLLFGGSARCHMFFLTHLDYREYREDTFAPVSMMEKGTGPDATVSPQEVEPRGVPTVFGAKLGPQVGRYFNFLLQTRVKRVGTKANFILQTETDGIVDLKCPLPLPKELPLGTAYATLIETWSKAGLD